MPLSTTLEASYSVPRRIRLLSLSLDWVIKVSKRLGKLARMRSHLISKYLTLLLVSLLLLPKKLGAMDTLTRALGQHADAIRMTVNAASQRL